ncbi:MAG: NifB/NifX family molybdenum-iron cluster-binding protein [Anaerolineales bacterium]
MDSQNLLKIAAVTEDGEGISSHFGMAPEVHVFTISGGKIVSEEVRAKAHHSHHPSPEEHGNGGHSHGHQHGDMLASMADCQVLLCGGMGSPAYQKSLSAGLEVVLVGGQMRDAVERYLKGDLTSDPRRIHMH